MKTIIKFFNSITDWVAKIACWFVVILVGVMSFEVIMRFGFRAPTMWAYETSLMLGASIAALAWAYDQRHNAHIRVDVIYERLPPRGRALIDTLGHLFFFFPFGFLIIQYSVSWAWRAWLTNEKMVETYWYPPAAPLRTVIALGFVMLTLHVVLQLIRDVSLLIRGGADN